MNCYSCLSTQQFEYGDYKIIPVQKEEIENIRLWRNNQMDILRQETKISSKEQKIYYKENIWPKMEEIEPNTILVSIHLNHKMIGYGGLVNISWVHKRAEVSFLSDPNRSQNIKFYNKDFSSFLNLIKLVGFDDLGLNRLYTETYDIRDKHISILESNGFKKEGVWRQHIYIKGKSIDSILHGCLNSDRF